MSREIKFRAWDGEKIYVPYYLGLHENHPISIFDDGRSLEDGRNNASCILMQFTGLKDKNGKEIFEGDVVQFVGGTCALLPCGLNGDYYERGSILVVSKLLSGFTLMRPTSKDNDIPNLAGNVSNYDFWNHQKSFEVIGDIYRNPELLSTN